MNQNNTKSEIDFKDLLTQIKKQGIAEINDFIDSHDFSEEEKKYLKTITPFNYTGIYKL